MNEAKRPVPADPSASKDPEVMSKKEFESYAEQVEEFEGPTRREVRGEEEHPKDENPPGATRKDPGVAHS
jgi:hypothetical protein